MVKYAHSVVVSVMSIRISNFASVPAEVFAEIQEELSDQHTLKDVMSWALSDSGKFIPGIVKDVIVQDEFTHDVIVPWGSELVFVYDTT